MKSKKCTRLFEVTGDSWGQQIKRTPRDGRQKKITIRVWSNKEDGPNFESNDISACHALLEESISDAAMGLTLTPLFDEYIYIFPVRFSFQNVYVYLSCDHGQEYSRLAMALARQKNNKYCCTSTVYKQTRDRTDTVAAYGYNAANAVRGSTRHRWARMDVCRVHKNDGPCMAAERKMHTAVSPASPLSTY